MSVDGIASGTSDCVITHFPGLDKKRTRSSRRMEGWTTGGERGLRAATAYAE
jgi:hypothetical protein